MRTQHSLSHTKWECKCHIVWAFAAINIPTPPYAVGFLSLAP
jgi:hypothetical protein